MDANKKGRFSSLARQSPGSILLHIIYETPVIFVLLLTSSAFLVSCNEELIPKETPPPAGPAAKTDSLPDYEVRIRGGGMTDIFIYDAGSGGMLEEHRRFRSPSDTTVRFNGSGDKIAVAIGDFPFEFRMEALQRYESLEQLELDIADDNPQQPVRSDVRWFTAGDTCILSPTALMCRIEVTRLENAAGLQYLLEAPAVFLSNANTSAELLRFTGFKQKTLTPDTLRTRLPHDIGVYPLMSGTALYCYPNDSPDGSIGNPSTSLVLECRIKGCRYEFPVQLPPFGRGAGLKLSYEIRSPEDWSYNIF